MATQYSLETELTMLRAAELYYYENLTHAQIAEQLNTSRWTVGRMLERARETGIVKITIEHPLARPHHLEVQLREHFGLRDAVVVPRQGDAESTAEAVCSAAAEHLAGLRPRPTSVGLSWGRTTSRVASKLSQGWNRGVTVVQTNGGLAVGSADLIGQSLRTMAERGPGQARLLQAPTMVGSPELGRILREDPAVARTLEAAAAARVIVFSPGAATATSVLVDSGYLSAEDVAGLNRKGVVGDVLSHFIDENGAIVDHSLDARTISMGLQDLRECPGSIAVVTGPDKLPVTRAILAAGLCRTLVTDADVAASLLGVTTLTTHSS